MNRKLSLIILSFILAIIVFILSINMQKKLINYVPTVDCLVATKDIPSYSKISENDFKVMQVPIELVASIRPLKSYDEIKGLYLKSDIYKGQLALYNQFDTGDNLMIFNGQEGKEKISIKVKNSENGVSFVLKKGSLINVYATINNEYANSSVFDGYEKFSAVSSEYGFSTIKILDGVKVLGLFDENGEEVNHMPERNIDTILVAVEKEEAYRINLIRDITTFNITEI